MREKSQATVHERRPSGHLSTFEDIAHPKILARCPARRPFSVSSSSSPSSSSGELSSDADARTGTAWDKQTVFNDFVRSLSISKRRRSDKGMAGHLLAL
jgi:hypothetical protein